MTSGEQSWTASATSPISFSVGMRRARYTNASRLAVSDRL
jgi:hypothetical protein